MTPDNNTMSAAEAAVTTREATLQKAVAAGKILPASIEDYRARWIREPRATAALIDSLAAGPLPSGDDSATGPALTAEQEFDLASTFGANRGARPTRDVGDSGYPSRVAIEEGEPAPAVESDLGGEAGVIQVAEEIVDQWFVDGGTG
jgi:hypothetical protein